MRLVSREDTGHCTSAASDPLRSIPSVVGAQSASDFCQGSERLKGQRSSVDPRLAGVFEDECGPDIVFVEMTLRLKR